MKRFIGKLLMKFCFEPSSEGYFFSISNISIKNQGLFIEDAEKIKSIEMIFTIIKKNQIGFVLESICRDELVLLDRRLRK